MKELIGTYVLIGCGYALCRGEKLSRVYVNRIGISVIEVILKMSLASLVTAMLWPFALLVDWDVI